MCSVGVNVVELEVIDLNGNSSTCLSNVLVADPTGLAAASVDLGPDQEICPNTTTTLDAGSGFIGYSWNTAESSQSIVVGAAGIYSVTVTNPLGCIGYDSVIVAEIPAPDSIITIVSNDALCEDDSATLNASPGFFGYTWNTGVSTLSITVNASGAYTVTVVDAGGCLFAETVTMDFIASPNPQPEISPGSPVFVCSGLPETLDGGPGYFSYSWSNGEETQFINVANPGMYTVTVTNGFGCLGVSDPVEVDTISDPTPIISRSSNTLSTATFVTYQWQLNGINISGATNSSYNMINTGSYTVIVTNSSGCEGISAPFLVDSLFEVGIEEELLAAQFNLYPNPATNRVTLSADAHLLVGELKVDLINKLGQVIKGKIIERRADTVVLALK